MDAFETRFNIGDRVQVKRSFLILPGENLAVRGGDTGTVKVGLWSPPFYDPQFSQERKPARVQYEVTIDQVGSIKFRINQDDLEPYVDPSPSTPVRSRLNMVVTALDLDSLNPITALTKLYELKRLAQEETSNG